MLCEPKDFVNASISVEDEYFLEPDLENDEPWYRPEASF
jgi:hypothetical protein